MKKGQKRGEKPEWFEFARDRWAEGDSTSVLLDKIAERFHTVVEESTISNLRKRNPDAFPARATAERKQVFRVNP